MAVKKPHLYQLPSRIGLYTDTFKVTVTDRQTNLGCPTPKIDKVLAVSIDGVTHWGAATLNANKEVIYDNRIPLQSDQEVIIVFNRTI